MRYPTFRQLQIFEAVARNKSYSRASEELNLSQSSVSEQIKGLTETIGTPLLEYVGKNLYLTDAGYKLSPLHKKIIKQLDSFYAETTGLSNQNQTCLRLSGDTSTQYFLPSLISLFTKQLPEIKISLKITSRQLLVEDMRQNIGELYVFGQVPDNIDIRAIFLAENSLDLLARPDHHLAGKDNFDIRLLEHEKFIFRESGSDTGDIVNKYFNKHHLSLDRALEIGANEAIKQSIISGLGISILPRHVTALEINQGQLIQLSVESLPIKSQWHIGYCNGKKPSSVARAFIDFIKEERALTTAFLEPQI